MPQHHAGQGLHLKVAQRRLLRQGEIANLRLRKLDITLDRFGHRRNAGLDLRLA